MTIIPFTQLFIIIGLSWLILINGLTFWIFGYDKSRSQAKQPQSRVPERTLLGLCLAGGWPLAWVAMTVLRHKTIKTSFRRKYWVAVLTNLVVVAGLLYGLL